MFLNTKKNNIKNISYLIYKKIVLYSRNKIFYTDLEVPDTIDGRFDLIILHLFLIHSVLFQKGSLEEKVYDEVLNVMYKDFDSNLREMGVGERGRKRPRPARAFLMGASWSLLEMAKSVVFKCFFVQKNFPQSLAVTKSEDCLREINKSFFPSLSVYSHPGL